MIRSAFLYSTCLLLLQKAAKAQNVIPVTVACLNDEVGFFLADVAVTAVVGQDNCRFNDLNLARISNVDEFDTVAALKASAGVTRAIWIGNTASVSIKFVNLCFRFGEGCRPPFWRSYP